MTSWRLLLGTSTPIACAGDGGEDADVGAGHRVGDVLVQAGDPGDLHARAELELVAGDGGADDHADEAGLDVVLGQRGLEAAAGLLDQSPVHVLLAHALQQAGGRQLPGPAGRPGGRVDLVGRDLGSPAARSVPGSVRSMTSSGSGSGSGSVEALGLLVEEAALDLGLGLRRALAVDPEQGAEAVAQAAGHRRHPGAGLATPGVDRRPGAQHEAEHVRW